MNTKILFNLGQRIKQARMINNFTQEDLAQIVGVHPTYIGKIEGGKSNISIKMLFKISRALKVKIPELFDFDK